MAKFYGEIGFIEEKETVPGVWEDPTPTERKYFGDVVRSSKRFEPGQKVNDDLTVNNEITILADPYAMNHFYTMRYINWLGTYWKINNVTVEYPRLRLTIGGVYNGPTAKTT